MTFTATVSVVSPGSTAVASPTGTVTFYDNGTSIGTGTLSVVNGHDQATFTTSALSTASHPITAAYTSGDGNFNASPVSTAVTQVVNKDSTTTAAGASPALANVGQAVTFTATVTANAPGSGTPTGTVDFYDTTTSTDLTPGGIACRRAPPRSSRRAWRPAATRSRLPIPATPISSPAARSTSSITIGQSIIVLDPSAGGASACPAMRVSSSPAEYTSIPAHRRLFGQRQRRDQSVGDRRARRRSKERQRQLQSRHRPREPRCWPIRWPHWRSRAHPA